MERERDGLPGSQEQESPGREIHEPQHAGTTAAELTTPLSTEPDLQEAVADLDAGPPPRRVETELAAIETPQQSAQPEPPRRRSTVRERAPVATGGDVPTPAPAQSPSPAPQPVITEAGDGDGENAERPRRSGWWSRRFAGG